MGHVIGEPAQLQAAVSNSAFVWSVTFEMLWTRSRRRRGSGPCTPTDGSEASSPDDVWTPSWSLNTWSLCRARSDFPFRRRLYCGSQAAHGKNRKSDKCSRVAGVGHPSAFSETHSATLFLRLVLRMCTTAPPQTSVLYRGQRNKPHQV